MKPPVESGYTSEGVPAREQVLLFNQLRAAANRVFQRTVIVQTGGNGAIATLWTDPDEVAHNTHVSMKVYAVASNLDGSVYGMWNRAGMFFRAADLTMGAAQLGALQDSHPPVLSHVGLLLGLGLDSNHLTVVGQDVISDSPIDWNLWIEGRVG